MRAESAPEFFLFIISFPPVARKPARKGGLHPDVTFSYLAGPILGLSFLLP